MPVYHMLVLLDGCLYSWTYHVQNKGKQKEQGKKEGEGNPSKKRKHALGKYEGKINKETIL